MLIHQVPQSKQKMLNVETNRIHQNDSGKLERYFTEIELQLSFNKYSECNTCLQFIQILHRW